MITKWYEVTCDCCGKGLNHYIDKKPTKEDLRNDGFVVYSNLIFCNTLCYRNYKQKQYEDRHKIHKKRRI